MKELLVDGDNAGCLHILRHSCAVNLRMVSMGFTAAVAHGCPVDTAAVQALQACADHGLSPGRRIHNNVLGVLSRVGPPEAVLAWVARMYDTGIEVDLIACNIQLKAHCALGNSEGLVGGSGTGSKLEQAVQLLSSMMRAKSDGPPAPNAISFNTVISALAQARQPLKAQKLLTTMVDSGLQADKHSFTGVILAFARDSQPEPAAKWLERMLQANVMPDTTTFNAVLLAYANTSDCEGAFHLMGKLEALVRDECPNARPDVCSFNTLLSACAKAGKPGRAEDGFFQMEKRGLEPDVVSFTTVINAHARAGNTQEAQAWLDAMVTRGKAPDSYACNAVCAAHARVGDAAAAMRCLARMADYGVTPSPTTHSILIHALSQAGEADAAESMLRDMVASGGALDASAFNILLFQHAKHGRPGRAMEVLSLMQRAHVRPSLVTFNSLASSYATYGDFEATEDALRQAKEHGFSLDRYSYGALLQACHKGVQGAKARGDAMAMKAKRQVAVCHVEAMLRSGIEVTEYLAAAACRAVGEAAYLSLQSQHRPQQRVHETRHRTMRQPYPVQEAVQEAGRGGRTGADLEECGAGAADKEVANEEATEKEGEEKADDGWQIVAPRASRPPRPVDNKGGGGGRVGGRPGPTYKSPKSPKSPEGLGGRHHHKGPSKSPIAKERPPTSSKRSTTPPHAKAADGCARGIDGVSGDSSGAGSSAGKDSAVAALNVRLQGRSFTRSKSERARLLMLAQDAMMASSQAEQTAKSPDAQQPATAIEGRTSTAPAAPTSWHTSPVASTSPAFSRLKRSAASELALCLEEDMTLT